MRFSRKIELDLILGNNAIVDGLPLALGLHSEAFFHSRMVEYQAGVRSIFRSKTVFS